MAGGAPDTDQLLDRASEGDRQAETQLFQRHRDRLKKMVAVRMDPRLGRRFDASDVVQDAMILASQRLESYLQERPVSFYPWLRQIAWERLARLHRDHLGAERRSLVGEVSLDIPLPDQSSVQLADQLAASQSNPSGRVMREELLARVRSVLQQLSPRDQEILVLTYLEQLGPKEAGDVLGISEGAANMRHLRSLRRFRSLMGKSEGEKP